MLNKIKYFFIAFFLIEIAGFVIVGELVGLWVTLLLVVLTTVLGVVVLQQQGMATASQSIAMMQGGRALDPEQLPNPLKTIAAMLLIIPGFVTDLLGLVLLVSPIRRAFEKKLCASGHIIDPRTMGAAANEPVETHNKVRHGETIEGEFERKDDEK
ncbi:MAG: FxsA family protein [Coxiellaceae bacterium]|nr:FxsA family protein [Coxiellaceae bacterium]